MWAVKLSFSRILQLLTGDAGRERETGIRGHNLSTTAEQVAMVWARAAKRRQ